MKIPSIYRILALSAVCALSVYGIATIYYEGPPLPCEDSVDDLANSDAWLCGHNRVRALISRGEWPSTSSSDCTDNNSCQPAPIERLARVEWDDVLADHAEQWASHLASECDGISHSGMPENIATLTHKQRPSTIVQAWAREANYFDFCDGSCTERCGHYRQIAEDDMTRVGCAVGSNDDCFAPGSGKWYFYVCNYNHGVATLRPYDSDECD